MTFNHKCFDAVPQGSFSRHLFIDAEKRRGGYSVVVRGQDKVLGVSGSADPALCWNEIDGDAKAFTLLTCDTEREVIAAVESLRALYTHGAETLPGMVKQETAVIVAAVLLLAHFPANAYRADNAARQRCDSYATRVRMSRATGYKQ